MRKTWLACGLLMCASAVAVAQNSPAPPPPPTDAAASAFSLATAERALDQFRDGLMGQNTRRALAAFDPQMPGYAQFTDTLRLLFDRYDQLRVYSKITETRTEGERATAAAEFTLEATPRDSAQPRLRRSTELRLTFAPAGKEWKVVDLQPREFFASF